MICLLAHILLLLSATFLLGSCIPQLIVFLSNQGLLGSYGLRYPLLRTKGLGYWTDIERQYVLSRLFKDFLLVALFVVQHSLMASDRWKRLMLHLRITISDRLIYVIASCLALNVMISRWMSTPDVMLWAIDTDEHSLVGLFFFLLHGAAWVILFLQVAVMDPLELIGVKQVFNYYKGKAAPLSYLPKQLRIFYHHLRHAGPTSIWVMLWIHPVMTLDRFLLALVFSLYFVVAHRVSLSDYKFAYTYFVVEETTTTTKHRVYKD